MSRAAPRLRPRASDFWIEDRVQTPGLDEGPRDEPTDLATAQRIDREYNEKLRASSMGFGVPTTIDQRPNNSSRAEASITADLGREQQPREHGYFAAEPRDYSIAGSAAFQEHEQAYRAEPTKFANTEGALVDTFGHDTTFGNLSVQDSRETHSDMYEASLRPRFSGNPQSSAYSPVMVGPQHPPSINFRQEQTRPTPMASQEPRFLPRPTDGYGASLYPSTLGRYPAYGPPPLAESYSTYPEIHQSSYAPLTAPQAYHPSQTPLSRPAQLGPAPLPSGSRVKPPLATTPLPPGPLAPAPPLSVAQPAPSTENSSGKYNKLCNNHHLRGACVLRDKCNYIHGALNPAELKELKRIAKGVPCKYGLCCDDELCYSGHKCPYPSCIGKCKFPKEMHYNGSEDTRGLGDPRVEARPETRTVSRRSDKFRPVYESEEPGSSLRPDYRQRTPMDMHPLKRKSDEPDSTSPKESRLSHPRGLSTNKGETDELEDKSSRRDHITRGGGVMLPPVRQSIETAPSEEDRRNTQARSPESGLGGVRLEGHSQANQASSASNDGVRLQESPRKPETHTQRHQRQRRNARKGSHKSGMADPRDMENAGRRRHSMSQRE